MARTQYLTLLALSFFLIFSACRKNQDNTVAPQQELSPAEYLQKNAYSPIIFHYAYTNETTQEKSGWFIDKWGALKTYQSNLQDSKKTPSEDQCGAHLIDNLYELATETSAQINLEDLVAKFKLIAKAQRASLTTTQANSTTELSAFYAFQFEENYEGTTHCYNDEGELVDVFNRVVLKTSGKQNQDNLSPEAQEILNWLLLIQEDHL